MKRRWFLIGSFILIMVGLAGCGKKVADEEQIQVDLEAYKKDGILSENEKIIEITIDKRQTEKDEKLDSVWCTVQTEDERCAYEKNFTLMYTLYDEGGWILDDVSVNGRSEWVITPLTGINNDEISASLNNVNLTVDNEIWYVSEDNIKSISVDNHKTDLEAETDQVTVSLTVDDLVEEAEGQLVIDYIFENGNWIMDSLSGNENFTSVSKQTVALNVEEESLLNAVNDLSFEYGSQEITVDKNKVSDFVIESQEASSKGTLQQFFCSCTLTEPHAAFTLKAEITYRYSGEWEIQTVTVTAECISAELKGSWTGNNVYGRACELNITEMDADGNISGTYSDYGSSYDNSYSYYVSGKLDWSTLEMYLKAGDMIGEKPYKWFEPEDIKARLNVEQSSIKGNADLGFTVTQE